MVLREGVALISLIRIAIAQLGWPARAAVAGVLAIVAIVVMMRSADQKAGGAAVREKINAANRAAADKADAGEREVLDCPAGKWSREKSKCEP